MENKYKLETKEGKEYIACDGHTMFLQDVVKDLNNFKRKGDIEELKRDIKKLNYALIEFHKLMSDYDISPMEWERQISSHMWKICHRKYKIQGEILNNSQED